MKTAQHPSRLARLFGLIVLGLVLLCTISGSALLLSNRALPTTSTIVDQLSENDKAYLEEVIHLRSTLGDTVWPGWGEADIPVIIYNERFAFLVGLDDPAPGWMKVPQMRQYGTAWEPVPGDSFQGKPYYRLRLPDAETTPEAFTVRVGDHYVASMTAMEWRDIRMQTYLREDLPPFIRAVFPYRIAQRLLLNGSEGEITAILHESFHAFQGQTAEERLAEAEFSMRQESEYPQADEILEEWQVELDLLAEAVRAGSDVEMRRLAGEFLEQRQARRNGLSEALVDYERQREWLEGQALYVELQIARAAKADEGYQPAPAATRLADFRRYSGADRRWLSQVDQIRRMAGEGDSLFYYSGMAQAFLLDSLLPGWKERSFQEGVWLEDLLAEALQ